MNKKNKKPPSLTNLLQRSHYGKKMRKLPSQNITGAKVDDYDYLTAVTALLIKNKS